MVKVVGVACAVIGIFTRTSNYAEFEQGAGRIQQVWQRFFAEDVYNKIPGKIDNDLLALYCDYASDKNGEYTYILGARVVPGTQTPEGMVYREIPVQTYDLTTTQKGSFIPVLGAAWQDIWQREDAGHLVRAYGVDYELYDERAHDHANAQLDIYISIK